jgi:thiosulfate sulfurtransferase
MEQFAHISVQDTLEKISNGCAKLLDIRDEQSFAAGHIDNAVHLTNANLAGFMAENEFDTPIIVCCYHGISSQQAAQFLIHQGFEEVYSMDGGFEAWRREFPIVITENS